MTQETRRQWICSTLEVPDGERIAGSPTQLVSMGVAAKKNLWNKGTSLKVRFLDGTPALHDRVMKAARSWLVEGVRLDLTVAALGEQAHFRIAFDPNGGSWSYVGTDCIGIQPSQPTMNLGWATLETSDQDFSSVVIHEFGHAFGLLHEHNHPEALIQWNRAAVYADLEGAPNYWSRETINSNVFAKFDLSQVIVTDFDKASVMIYTIPTNWTLNGKSFMPSWKLSAGDVATIKRLYS